MFVSRTAVTSISPFPLQGYFVHDDGDAHSTVGCT